MWINQNTNQVFTLHSEIRSAFNNVSFPRDLIDEIIASVGVLPVTQVPRPEVDHTKNVTEGTPTLQDGVWTQVWVVTNAAPEDIEDRERQQLRDYRNSAEVYRRAFRLALQQTPYGDTNLLIAIEAHAATLDPYDSVRMAWEDVTIFERTHPDMSMFSALGMTDEQIDDIFRLAQSIEAGA